MKKIIVLLFFILLLCGCSDKATSMQLFSMDTVMDVKLYSDKDGKTLEKIKEEIYSVEKMLDRGDENSDVYRLNNGQAEVSGDCAALLERLLDISVKTEGAFDMTVAPVMDLWGFYDGKYRVPQKSELENALKSVNYRNVFISGNNAEVLNNARIDLGGAGKGYAADRIVKILNDYNIKSAIINLGGNVYAHGRRYDKKRWRVGIANPFDSSDEALTVDVEDKAVVTSGAYRRNFEHEGKIYHHIIDPETGYPAENDIKSVTVISSSATVADAYSTALFVMGSEKAIEFLVNNTDVDAIIITEDKTVHYTAPLSGSVNVKNGFTEKEISE